MRYLPLICLLILLSRPGGITAAETHPDAVIYLKWDTELIPRLDSGHWQTGSAGLDALLRNYPLKSMRPAFRHRATSDPVGIKRILRLELERAADRPALLAALRRLPAAEYAEELPVRHTDGIGEKGGGRGLDNVPGDPLYPEQWCFPVMQAPSAWDLTKGDPSIVIAIVDNGTDWNHEDLADNIWINPGEIAYNGVDDDGNGFVDDLRGWDFMDDDNNPEPEVPPGQPSEDYHGTHTAGLVGAVMNNQRGVVGMAPSSLVMPVRTGLGGSIYWGLEGILYAAHNGADIINLSWGGTGAYTVEQDIIDDARLQGCLIAAAAGNESGSTPHYPAAYEGVLAVAATSPNDGKWSGSNYGTWVSVCAPGDAVLSLFPLGYGAASGTSMSTPLVAGVAALVKAYHPAWSADQIYAQILYTADDIDPKNPLYQGWLGTGRVNAYRAVTETAPGLQVVDLSFTETGGNFDGNLDPGDQAELILSLQNMGETTSSIQVTLSSTDSGIQVDQGNWHISELASGETADNSADPFEITILPLPADTRKAELIFTVESENFYQASLTSFLWINPNFADHDTGNVIFTLTDFGAFGYCDYTHPSDDPPGSGFRFPKEGSNALFHGSLMAGISPSKVSDCAYGGSYIPRYDWRKVDGGGILIFPGSTADQEGTAVYQDTNAPVSERVGLQVTQHSYAWNAPPNDDFIILSFNLENVSGGALSNLYVGLYMDWDLIYFDQNEAGWDSLLALGYVYNGQVLAPNTRYYGTCLLSDEPASYRVIDSSAVYPPTALTDEIKYEFMSVGFVQTQSTQPWDQATLLSAGPYSLSAGGSVEVTFAALGGDDLNDLKTNAAAAHNAWNSLAKLAFNPTRPSTESFVISRVFPRPANGALRLSFTLPGPGEVLFDLIDPLGRSLPIWRGNYTQAGSYDVIIPRWDGASGLYWLRGTSSYGRSVAKIVWVK